MASFDLAVAGAGIVGLAHALAAARRGLRVVVLERDAQATAASVRNFGFVTVTGQEAGATRARALRSRDVWLEVAREAGIEIHQRGALVAALRPEALRVLEEFLAGDRGGGCELWDASTARTRLPALDRAVAGVLASPHELRVEAREALPRIARWLEERHGVVFAWGTPVLGVEEGRVRHASGELKAHAIVVAPGAGVAAFAPDLARRIRLRVCKLQMLRLADPGFRLPGVLMADLSLVRYGGFAAQPSAARLRAVLERDRAPQLAHGVHLIVAQSLDGKLVVGDSHHEAEAPDAVSSNAVDELILDELHAVLDVPNLPVVERWLGFYPVADAAPVVSEALAPRVRLVSVTSGTGMSTAFALGEETLRELFG